MASVGGPGFVEDRLDRYRTLTLGAVMSYLPRHEPRRYLYDLVSDYPLRAGKGLRPALCIATCRAFGGDLRDVLNCAAAIELYHNAFIVHDDLEDASEHRRGLPTLHIQHGMPIAVNVGDALSVLSLRPLIDNLSQLGPEVTLRVFEEIEHMVRESVEGQAIDLGWMRDNALDVTDRDYLRMVLKKTCWYTCIHPCRIGAMVGTRNAVDLDPFDEFGYFMGAAFQIQDDVLNLVGDSRYGKEIGGDVWEGKRTLMLIHLAGKLPSGERERLSAILATGRASRREADVRWILRRMDDLGSIEYARACAGELARAALDRFDACYGGLPDSVDKRFVHDVVRYVVERDS